MSLKEQRVYEEFDTQWVKGEISADEYFDKIRAQVRSRNEEDELARNSALATHAKLRLALRGVK